MPTPLVADAIAHYDELLAGRCDPSGWWPRHAGEVRRRWHDEAPVEAFVLRPLMIDEATYAATRASLAQVVRALSLATDRLAADEPLRRALGMPAYLEPLLELDRETGRPTCLGRFDGLMTDGGELALIEFNSEPQSVPFQYELERSFERLPIAEEFARKFRVRTVDLYEQMYAALAERGRGGRMPCVAVLDKALWRSHRRAGIIVTGAASGLGASAARFLCREGAAVSAVDVDAAGLGALRGELAGAAGRIAIHAADVSSEQDASRAVKQAVAEHGTVNGLINSAGIYRDGAKGHLSVLLWSARGDSSKAPRELGLLPATLEEGVSKRPSSGSQRSITS